MTTRQQKFWTVTLIAASLFLTTCRKDIPLPNPAFENLFGTWDWIQSSGGISGGQTMSPSTEGYSWTVDYKDNGIYKKYENGKKISKMTFKFQQSTSIYSPGQTYLIEYKNGSIGKAAENIISHSFKFGGQDTLFLFDECYDCYSHIYIRQK